MRHFQLTRRLLGRKISADILCLEQGLHVSVYGGDLPHIGAISIVSPDGMCSTIQFPTHRDSAVSERWARTLATAGYCPSVVEVGIHYDQINEQGISDVLFITSEMLNDVLNILSKQR